MIRLASLSSLLVIVALLAGCKGPSAAIPESTAPTPAIGVPASESSSPQLMKALPTQEARIWARLRQGKGYVILLRHALAPGTGDPANFRLGDCSTQRNLSSAGRRQASQIGEVVRQQKIVVAQVLSSQWCRCLETASLLQLGPVKPFPVLNSFFQDRSTEAAQTEQLRRFILANRNNPGVTIMVTHQVNITAISNIVPPAGSAVVMRPDASDQIELVGQLSSF